MSAVPSWKIVIVAALAGLLPALSGCAGPPSRHESAVADLVAQADAVPTPQLDWAPCAEPGLSRFHCATVQVPVDYAHPDGPTLGLAVVRQQATDPQRRIGTLFSAVGGPGGSGLRWAAEGELVGGELARRFDVVTFDQRGVGRSGQVRCFPDAEQQRRFWTGALLPPANPEQERAADVAGRELAAGCAAHGGALLGHLTTVDAARDLDLLRRAVGDPQLTYEGGSYASYLGQVYGALFGDRVRALHLASMIDPDTYTNDTRSGIESAAAGTEEVFGEFLRLCAEAGRAGCPFAAQAGQSDALVQGGAGDPVRPADLRARNDAVLHRLRAAPQVVGTGERARTLTYSEVLSAHALLLYDPKEGWPALARLLAELERGPAGDPDAVREILDATALPYDFLDSFTAISCADNAFPRDPGQWPALARDLARVSPTYGAFWLSLRRPCASWQSPPEGYAQRYTGPWILRSDTPALLVNNRFDPATPLSEARRAQQELVNARLVVVEEGYGHTPLNDCTRKLRERYLVDLHLPAPGATCRPDELPFGR
ncbi:alpha/beta hydrolase [Nocardia abscessus]|uniref:alpha/beta hydrolase n=1 Tax=Nocardia abscessus TaxID=120957 RepID=UPI00245910E2|nr:alpha/beta hydrolase [Nocardia abscessus]